MKTESDTPSHGKRDKREWQAPVLSKESAMNTSGAKIHSSVEFAPDLGVVS